MPYIRWRVPEHNSLKRRNKNVTGTEHDLIIIYAEIDVDEGAVPRLLSLPPS